MEIPKQVLSGKEITMFVFADGQISARAVFGVPIGGDPDPAGVERPKRTHFRLQIIGARTSEIHFGDLEKKVLNVDIPLDEARKLAYALVDSGLFPELAISI